MRDREQFVGRIVGEIDVVGDARAEPRVAREEGVHPVLVAGEDYDQVVALVLHDLEQYLDRLGAVVAFVLGAVQVVGLVDEEHAAHRAFEDFFGLGRGVADVLSDQVVAGGHDHVSLAHVTQAVQDFGHARGDGRLARARPSGEGHVQRRRLRGQADAAPHLVDQQQVSEFANARLDRREPHQFAVEFSQDFADLRGAIGFVEVEPAVRAGHDPGFRVHGL